MDDLPNLSETSPDRWLSKVDKLHDEISAELTDALDGSDDVERLAETLDELFAEYRLESTDTMPSQLLEVERREGRVALRHPSEEDWAELESDDDTWRLVDRALDSSDDRPHHRRLAEWLLQRVPLWSEGAFAPEVGSPREFVSDED